MEEILTSQTGPPELISTQVLYQLAAELHACSLTGYSG